jgi:hypothetical protein
VPPAALFPRFFERVIRQSFRDLACDDPPVARYLVDLLTGFARAEALHTVRGLPTRRLDTVADSLLAIPAVWDLDAPDFNPAAEQALRRHIGDYTLFMTGVFREHVERLALIDYYQREGSRAYRFVAETARTGSTGDAALFRRLSTRFEYYAGALSYARKVYFPSAEWPPTASPRDPVSGALVWE